MVNLIALLLLLCTVVITFNITFTITFTIWKTLLHIIIWHFYKGVIRMFYEFYECLLLSLEFTIFINTIFQSFIFTSKSRDVSTFNLVLFYQTFSLSMTSFLFSVKKKKENGEGRWLHCTDSRRQIIHLSDLTQIKRLHHIFKRLSM